MKNFIRELPHWKHEMPKEEYDKILLELLTFFGSVPSIPNALKDIDEPDTIVYQGGFDNMSIMINAIGTNISWIYGWNLQNNLHLLQVKLKT